MRKQYDRDYFQHWYRDPAAKIIGKANLQRRVALALALAEFALDRPVRTVLDVGCGEGSWRAPLLKLRPGLIYLGVDSSEYAIRRYARSRNLAYARFADLESLRPCPPVDLLICADVLHYLPASDLRRGLAGFPELCSGVAYIENYCRGDHIEGDLEGFIARPAKVYRELMCGQGFSPYGPFSWISPVLRDSVVELALPKDPSGPR
jgi:SAM-dependent methyltransferase